MELRVDRLCGRRGLWRVEWKAGRLLRNSFDRSHTSNDDRASGRAAMADTGLLDRQPARRLPLDGRIAANVHSLTVSLVALLVCVTGWGPALPPCRASGAKRQITPTPRYSAEPTKTRARRSSLALPGAAACTVLVLILPHALRKPARQSGVAGVLTAHRPVIAVMPKAKGDPYFISARAGAEEAAHELGAARNSYGMGRQAWMHHNRMNS